MISLRELELAREFIQQEKAKAVELITIARRHNHLELFQEQENKFRHYSVVFEILDERYKDSLPQGPSRG